MGKLFFNLAIDTGLEGNSEFKPVKFRLKMTLCPFPLVRRGCITHIYIYIYIDFNVKPSRITLCQRIRATHSLYFVLYFHLF